MAPDLKILSTGSLPDASGNRLTVAGIVVDIIPFIRTSSAVTDAMNIRKQLQQQSVVVFTSAAAVAAVVDCLDPDTVYPVHLYCIGGATATAAAAFFGTAAIRAAAPDGAALAGRIIEHKENAVLFYCGDRRLDTLVRLVTEAGIRLTEEVVYTTVLVPQQLVEQYDGILFFSPSAAESFFSSNTIAAGTVLFAIGSTTAAALKQYSSNKTIIAAIPSKEALAACVLNHFKK